MVAIFESTIWIIGVLCFQFATELYVLWTPEKLPFSFCPKMAWYDEA